MFDINIMCSLQANNVWEMGLFKPDSGEHISMGMYQVTCITKRGGHYNPHERIEYIGNEAGNWRLSEDAAIRRIESGTDSFYTFVNGRKANLIVADHY